MRKPAVIIAAVLAALALAGCGSAQAPAAMSPSSPAPSPAPAEAAPALTRADRMFVRDVTAVLAARGEVPGISAVQTARDGQQVCRARREGAAQSAIAERGEDAQIARIAERDLCPAFLPRVLLRFSGSGDAGSRPFGVTSRLTLTYRYDCASYGYRGNFIVDVETAGNPSSGSWDDEEAVNLLGNGGKAMVSVYPEELSEQYHVSVTSECDWSVVVRG